MTDGLRAGLSPHLAALLALLRDGAPRTRAQLVEISGLSRSTVATRLDALQELGLVGPAGGDASSGGRPPAFVAFRPDAALVLAIDLGARHGVVAVADLAGGLLRVEQAELDIADGPEQVLGWALATGRRLLAETARSEALVGIGIGVPGPVEHSTGRPVNPPIMPGWDRYDVPARVRADFDVPVLVDNDVNLLALGEHATVWPQVDELLFVKVATGIGAGIIAGGRLQRGAQGSAGDLGHVLVPSGDGSVPPGALDADLEARASGPAIARRLALPTGGTSSDEVVDLVSLGDPDAIRAVRQAGRDLGEVLATAVNLLNPEVLVVGGGLARAGEHLLAGVREVVYGRSTPLATQHLTIAPSRSGVAGGAIGAAVLVAQHLLGPASPH